MLLQREGSGTCPCRNRISLTTSDMTTTGRKLGAFAKCMQPAAAVTRVKKKKKVGEDRKARTTQRAYATRNNY